jgi:hypothetical protein
MVGEHGELDRRRAAGPVGIVEQLAGALVVDDVVREECYVGLSYAR